MADCTYCRTRWSHGLQTYPKEIWSELGGYRFEVRRLEVFADGTMLWTSPEESAGADAGATPLPDLAELADDPDCEEAAVVTAEQFETIWARRREHRRG